MGTHPIFESDFDCLTEARADYGFPLKSHPVQDVIPKREPINYIRNTLYPKAGSRFLLLPRQYALVPHNNGVYWGAWRYGHSRANIYLAALIAFVGHLWAANSAYGGKFNKSWRGGDSILYGTTGKNLHDEHVTMDKLGRMYN